MKKVVIFGNGQLADIAHAYFTFDSPFEVAAFCVDEQFLNGDCHQNLPLVAFEQLERLYPPSEFSMFLPISAKKANHLRAGKFQQAKDKGYDLVSYISPKALVFPQAQIGANCFIFENNVIQPFARIGDDCILWSGNHIGHHSTIMDHCFITSHVVISGRVTVEPYCFFGVNATVRDGITIGTGSVIGAGALIMRDTKANEVYVSSPTKAAPFTSDSARLF